jgi:hypothetical protein
LCTREKEQWYTRWMIWPWQLVTDMVRKHCQLIDRWWKNWQSIHRLWDRLWVHVKMETDNVSGKWRMWQKKNGIFFLWALSWEPQILHRKWDLFRPFSKKQSAKILNGNYTSILLEAKKCIKVIIKDKSSAVLLPCYERYYPSWICSFIILSCVCVTIEGLWIGNLMYSLLTSVTDQQRLVV